MIFVGIDISIDSTAVTVHKNGEYIFYNYTTKSKDYLWIKKSLDLINFTFIDYEYKKIDDFSKSLINQLMEFDIITTKMYNDLNNIIDSDTIVYIENFNYGLRQTNIIVDIVTFSTLLKNKINSMKFDGNLEHIELISPKSLKLYICESTYSDLYSEKKTKKISRNSNGIPGGSFKKSDVLKAFVDCNIQTKITPIVIENFEKLISPNGETRKPYEDICDSFFLCEMGRKKFLNYY